MKTVFGRVNFKVAATAALCGAAIALSPDAAATPLKTSGAGCIQGQAGAVGAAAAAPVGADGVAAGAGCVEGAPLVGMAGVPLIAPGPIVVPVVPAGVPLVALGPPVPAGVPPVPFGVPPIPLLPPVPLVPPVPLIPPVPVPPIVPAGAPLIALGPVAAAGAPILAPLPVGAPIVGMAGTPGGKDQPTGLEPAGGLAPHELRPGRPTAVSAGIFWHCLPGYSIRAERHASVMLGVGGHSGVTLETRRRA